MGTWGHRIFENDGTVDCLYEMMESHVEEFLSETFEVVGDIDYLEIVHCNRIIACAAVIDMVLNQTSHEDLDMSEFEEWIEELGEVDLEAFIVPAAKGLDRILDEDSELKELWEDNEEELDAWESSISDLLNNLG